MSEDLLATIAELQGKVEMYERMLKLYEQQVASLQHNLDTVNSNLRLSIQTPTSGSSRAAVNNAEFSTTKIFSHTFISNLDDISDEKVQVLLEQEYPSYTSMIAIIERGLRGEFSEGEQLAKLTTNKFCKFINDQGETKLETMSTLFDIIFDFVYERCKPLVTKLTSKVEEEEYNETTHKNNDNQYNNMMMLKEPRHRQRLIKDSIPLLR